MKRKHKQKALRESAWQRGESTRQTGKRDKGAWQRSRAIHLSWFAVIHCSSFIIRWSHTHTHRAGEMVGGRGELERQTQDAARRQFQRRLSSVLRRGRGCGRVSSKHNTLQQQCCLPPCLPACHTSNGNGIRTRHQDLDQDLGQDLSMTRRL